MKTIFSFIILGITCNICIAQNMIDSVHVDRAIKVKKAVSPLGKNIFAVSPIQFLSNRNLTADAHEGFGVSYERILLDGYLGIMLPVNFKKRNAGFYLMPALKFYPRKQGNAKFAIGPQLLILNVEEQYLLQPYTPDKFSTYTYADEVRKQIGAGLNASINITIFKYCYIGMDASAGLILNDSFKNKIDYPSAHGSTPKYINIGGVAGIRF